jgi:hypothetical protein
MGQDQVKHKLLRLMGWQQADQIIGDIKAKATLDVFVLVWFSSVRWRRFASVIIGHPFHRVKLQPCSIQLHPIQRPFLRIVSLPVLKGSLAIQIAVL